MSEDSVTIDSCHELREKIYSMIFPRWMLISIGGVIVVVLLTLYTLNGRTTVAAADAMKKAELIQGTQEIENKHIKESIDRIETAQIAQQKLLVAIDKKLPDNGH